MRLYSKKEKGKGKRKQRTDNSKRSHAWVNFYFVSWYADIVDEVYKRALAFGSTYGSFPRHFPNIINVTSAVTITRRRVIDGTCPTTCFGYERPNVYKRRKSAH